MLDAASVSPDQTGAPDEDVGRKRKRQKISRVIRAVFIETSLARKIRNRKLKRQSSRWEIREPSETADEGGSLDLNPASSETENSNPSSPTDSGITTICLLPENKESDSRKIKRNSVNLTALFFPVILLVLILLGKAYAIFFTSTWLLGISFTTPKGPETSTGGRGLHTKHYLRGPLFDL